MLPEPTHDEDHILVGGQGRLRRTCPDALWVVQNRGPRQCHGALKRTILQRHRWPHAESIRQADGRHPRLTLRRAVLRHG